MSEHATDRPRQSFLAQCYCLSTPTVTHTARSAVIRSCQGATPVLAQTTVRLSILTGSLNTVCYAAEIPEYQYGAPYRKWAHPLRVPNDATQQSFMTPPLSCQVELPIFKHKSHREDQAGGDRDDGNISKVLPLVDCTSTSNLQICHSYITRC